MMRRPACLAAAAVGLVLLCYLPALTAPFFIVDDYQYVVDNTRLQEIPLSKAWRVVTDASNPWEYLPVRDLSYRVDFALFGLRPVGFRVHNLVLYALCCLAVWLCTMAIQRMLVRGDGPRRSTDGRAPWIAACVVALYAAHPAHVESVAWVAGRKDLLSGLLALLSLWMFSEGYRRAPASRARLLTSYILFLLGILSKSSIAALPLVAFLLAVAAERTRGRSLLRPLVATAPLVLIAGLSVVLQIFHSETSALRHATLAAHPWRPETWDLPVRILGALTRVGLLPLQLRLNYDVQQGGWVGWASAGLGCLAAAAAVAATRQVLRHRALAGFGVAWFVLLALPFLQLIPFNTSSYASERFLFLSTMGLCLAIAACLVGRPPKLRTVAVVLLFLAWSGLTCARAHEWSSRTVVLQTNAERAPSHSTAARLYIHYVLLKDLRFAEAHAVASKVREPGDRAFLQLYVTATEYLHQGNLPLVRGMTRQLLAAAPREDYAIRMDLANMAMEAGQYADAEAAYRAILDEAPARAGARYNLGLVLGREGRHAEGAGEVGAAIQQGFESAVAWNNLGLLYKNSGDPTRAEAAFEAALRAEPEHWHAAYNLARMKLVQGDTERAREALALARTRAEAAGDAASEIQALLRSIEPEQDTLGTNP